MRRVFCLLIAVTLVCLSFAQEDIPTYHNKRESFSKVTQQDIRTDLATFTLAGVDESVGKQMTLASVPVTDYSNDFVQFSKDNLQIKIISGKFDQSRHKIQYYDKYVARIDNKPFYGIDGAMPKKTIESVVVIAGRDTINVPLAAFSDLYEPRFCGPDNNGQIKCNCGAYISNDKRRIYIYMLNSSGKGGYEVTWVLQDNQYLRRVIDYGF
ncbi:MAG TPA: hypothetical protein VH396_04370 [Chitinophagaceae bacterium]